MSIYQRLADIQKELDAPKSQYNEFGGYHYRNCEDILSAVKPLLGNLIITTSDEIVLIGDRFYVKATATITDGKESITAEAYAREPDTKKKMDASQITGASSSYARKYALGGLLAIDDTKDADAEEGQVKQETRPRQHNAEADSVQADAETIAQLNAAETMPDLVKTMNSLSHEQKRAATPVFNQRMKELKEAA